MVEQWMDGGAAGCSSPKDHHSERSEPEGVMPPPFYGKGKLHQTDAEGYPFCLCPQMKWGGAPLRLGTFRAGISLRKPRSEIPPFLNPKEPYFPPF